MLKPHTHIIYCETNSPPSDIHRELVDRYPSEGAARLALTKIERKHLLAQPRRDERSLEIEVYGLVIKRWVIAKIDEEEELLLATNPHTAKSARYFA